MAKLRLTPGPNLECAGCRAVYSPELSPGETEPARIVSFAQRHRRCREQPRVATPLPGGAHEQLPREVPLRG
jgi:hypothetical protein